jgi:hypothetical protein
MKGVRFYEELGKGTVVALYTDTGRLRSTGPMSSVREYTYDAVVGVHDIPNSPVASGSVGAYHLGHRCKRVSEARARQVHPALFTTWLDRED